MTTDAEKTEWSLPGPDEMPKDRLNLQLEVYEETLLLRGFEGESTWVRTVSADEIANVFTQHLGFSSGLLPPEALWWNQGETGQIGGPLAAASGLVRWPCNGRRSGPPHGSGFPMPGLVFVCSPGRAPWVYAAQEQAERPRAAPIPDARLQRLFRRTGLPRKPPVPGGCRTDTRVLLPVLLLPHRETAGTARTSTPKTCKTLWEELDGKTEYPMEDLVPHCTVAHAMEVIRGETGLWLPLAAGLPPATDGPRPVGYLVNHPRRAGRSARRRLRLRSRIGRTCTSSPRTTNLTARISLVGTLQSTRARAPSPRG